MVIITDARGNIQTPTVPENIYQGSNIANDIVFLCPLPQTSQASITFRLPNGQFTEEHRMTQYTSVPSNYNLSAWIYSVKSEITEYYGQVGFQIRVYNSVQTITTCEGTFIVQKGVAPLPSIPSQDTFDEILAYLSTLTDMAASQLMPYDEDFVYGLGVLTQYNGDLYLSKVPDNQGNSLDDTEYWEKKEIGIYYCTYETTTYEEITNAVSKGLLPIFIYDNCFYTYATTNSDTHVFTCNTMGLQGVLKVASVNSLGWTINNYTFQEKNLVTTISNTSTDTQYPSAKSVYTALLSKQDTLSADQQNAVNSGITSSLVGKITTNESNITAINEKIPTQASSSNQLADKNYVDNSINSVTAYYITKNAQGDPFATKLELTSATVFYSGGVVRVPTRNDYCIVLADETKDNATTRYSYQNNQWEYQYTINESPLTVDQLAAINSGITSSLVTKLNGIESGAEVNDVNDVQVDGVSVVSSKTAQISTINSNYNASTNKIATASDISGMQTTSNLVTTVSSNSTDTQYPSAKCLYDNLILKQNALPTTTSAGYVLKATSTAGTTEWGTLSASDVGALPSNTTYVSSVNGSSGAITGIQTTSNLVTSLNPTSTNSEYPSAKCTYDALGTKQNKLSTAQQNAVDSGITSSLVTQIGTNQSNISTINGKIPSQASSENQLADKNFVNSSIATNTANFIGTFENVTDLNAYSGTVTNNDYAFVINQQLDFATTTAMNNYDKTLLTNYDYAWVENGAKFDLYRFNIVEQTWDSRETNIAKTDVSLIVAYNRYKYNSTTSEWVWEYTLNTSGFTAAQWSAINSGITSTLTSKIGTAALTTTATDLSSAINELNSGKQNNLPTTTSASQVLKSTTTAGTVEWGTLSASDVGALANTTTYVSSVNGTSGAVTGIQTTSNLVTTITSNSTNSQYPSAKCIYDELQLKQNNLPTTTTSGQLLKSTSTAGTVEWSSLSASDVGALPDSTKYGASLSVSGTSVQLKDQDGNNLGSAITTQDTGATSVETTGSGNAVTSTSYNPSNRKITFTKGETFLKTSEYVVDSSLSKISENPVQNKVIAELIPSVASSENQLADKNYVNSSISTATATFRGTYNLVSDLGLTTSATNSQIAAALSNIVLSEDKNDYCFVKIPTSDSTPTEIERVDRFKYNGTSWSFEYSLNNSGFTAAQWNAINSGLSSADKTKLDGIESGAEVNDVTDVQINGTSILSSKTANIITNSTYNASTNKIATMSDLPTDTGATSVELHSGDTGNVVTGLSYDVSTRKITYRKNITAITDISSKQDKNVGSANSGKILKVDSSGDIAVSTVAETNIMLDSDTYILNGGNSTIGS